MFQATYGYYARGVALETVLPDGWRKRLVKFRTPATNGVTAVCLERHDLWVSKAIAGRPKDREFCRALHRGLVRSTTLGSRLSKLSGLHEDVRHRVEGRIARREG